MAFVNIRTTDNYPRYVEYYWGDTDEVVFTKPDTNRWTGEDDAQEFTIIEANCVIKELETKGIVAEIC